MSITPRPYAGLHDLEAMKTLVVEGSRAVPGFIYPHPGDLDWWLFYGAPSRGQALSEAVWLWYDENERLNGWVYINGCDFDMALQPELRGTAFEAEVVSWTEAHLMPQAQQENKPVAAAAWQSDTALCSLLEAQGYTGSDYLIAFERTLEGTLPQADLPPGFSILNRMYVNEADQRADAHANSFSPSRMTTEHYEHFMQAPGYDLELDVVVLSPHAIFAAYAMCWIDSVNHVGIFEPVGTRKDMQRKGLGKAALVEGMERMKARGMKTVHVLTWIKDTGNIAFYKSVGFEPANVLKRFEKQPVTTIESINKEIAPETGASFEVNQLSAFDKGDDLTTIDAYVTSKGLKPIGECWRKIDSNEAVKLVTGLLHKSMAYSSQFMPLDHAARLAAEINRIFTPPTRFYTNELDGGGWMSVTDATFDRAVIYINQAVIGSFVIQDED